MAERKPVAFLSYTRADDEYEHGALTRFHDELSRTLRFLHGDRIDIFLDVHDIALGQDIRRRIREALNEIILLIPIITPSYFKSPWCREELELFLERGRQLGRDDLILSIYYQSVPDLDTAMQHPSVARPATDPLLAEIARRLASDWRELRGKDVQDQQVRAELERIAGRIIEVVGEMQASPPPPPAPTKPDTGSGDTIDARGSQGFVNRPEGPVTQHFGSQRTINTGGGDYTEGNIDKRQGAFISGGTVYGPVVGSNQGSITAHYGSAPPGGSGDSSPLSGAVVAAAQAIATARQQGEADLAYDLEDVQRDLEAALKAEVERKTSRRAARLRAAQKQVDELAAQHPALSELALALRRIA